MKRARERRRAGRAASTLVATLAHVGLILVGSRALVPPTERAGMAAGHGAAVVTMFGPDVLSITSSASEFSGSSEASDDAPPSDTVSSGEDELTPVEAHAGAGNEAAAASRSTGAGAAGPPGEAASGTASGGGDDPWSRASLLPPPSANPDPVAAIHAEASRCWRRPPTGPAVRLSVVLDHKGGIVGRPTPVHTANAPVTEQQREAEMQASKALEACAPYALAGAPGQREIYELTF